MTKKISKKKKLKDKILNSSPEEIEKIIDVATQAAVKRNKKWQEKTSIRETEIKNKTTEELVAGICENTEFKKVGEIRAERGVGKPSTRTKEIEEKILERISKGESMAAISKDEDMPSQTAFYEWLALDNELAERYVRAREAYADVIAEQLVEISDDGSNDWMLSNHPENPGYVLNGEHVQRSKLRIDTRKWIASKLKPKKYGDSLNIKGEIETKPSPTTLSQFSPENIMLVFKHGLPLFDVEMLEKVGEMVENELQKKRSTDARIINQT